MGNYSVSMMLQQQLSIQGTEEHGLAFKEISPNWA